MIVCAFYSEKLSTIGGDSEDTESGFIESERLDSGIPSSLSGGCTESVHYKYMYTVHCHCSLYTLYIYTM